MREGEREGKKEKEKERKRDVREGEDERGSRVDER